VNPEKRIQSIRRAGKNKQLIHSEDGIMIKRFIIPEVPATSDSRRRYQTAATGWIDCTNEAEAVAATVEQDDWWNQGAEEERLAKIAESKQPVTPDTDDINWGGWSGKDEPLPSSGDRDWTFHSPLASQTPKRSHDGEVILPKAQPKSKTGSQEYRFVSLD
jgi:hypothetical protein